VLQAEDECSGTKPAQQCDDQNPDDFLGLDLVRFVGEEPT